MRVNTASDGCWIPIGVRVSEDGGQFCRLLEQGSRKSQRRRRNAERLSGGSTRGRGAQGPSGGSARGRGAQGT